MGGRNGLFAGCLAAAMLLPGCGSGQSGDAAALAGFEQETAQWRERRLARLTDPYGWLSLVALEFVGEGRHTIGRSGDNDIVVPDGPARWGVLYVEDGTVEFRAQDDIAIPADAGDGRVQVDGRPVSEAILAENGAPTDVRLSAGRVQVHLVNPGGRLAVRVRDPESPARSAFQGLDYFPPEPAWRLEARFEPHPAGRTIQIANVAGQLLDRPNPGAAVFVVNGREFRLEAVAEEDEERLFFIFADRTSGRETYGLGRFLYADWPEGGRMIVDFNQAYNPPCAFTEFTTCPLPPPENRLDLRVEAGERAYHGGGGIHRPEAIPAG